VLIFVLCVVGLFPLLDSTLPVPAIVPVLLYIGLVIGARAFRSVPRAHYAAVVLAIVANAAACGERADRKCPDGGVTNAARSAPTCSTTPG